VTGRWRCGPGVHQDAKDAADEILGQGPGLIEARSKLAALRAAQVHGRARLSIQYRMCPMVIPMVIATIRLHPSQSDQAEGASILTCSNPSCSDVSD
jgi:hypothetical protein